MTHLDIKRYIILLRKCAVYLLYI